MKISGHLFFFVLYNRTSCCLASSVLCVHNRNGIFETCKSSSVSKVSNDVNLFNKGMVNALEIK